MVFFLSFFDYYNIYSQIIFISNIFSRFFYFFLAYLFLSVYNQKKQIKKRTYGALAIRRIGNQVRVLNEPITVRAEQTTKTTVFNGKVWRSAKTPSQETCL